MPAHNSEYLSAAYWDKRFEDEVSYEWLHSYEAIQALLAAHLDRADRILIVGCGTSALPTDMAADGYCNITSTDISPAVITRMQQQQQQQQEKHNHLASIHWQV